MVGAFLVLCLILQTRSLELLGFKTSGKLITLDSEIQVLSEAQILKTDSVKLKAVLELNSTKVFYSQELLESEVCDSLEVEFGNGIIDYNLDFTLSLSNGITVDCSGHKGRKLLSSPRIEYGRVTAFERNSSTRVYFSQPFKNPIVIAMVNTHNGDESVTCRINNLTSTGFDVFLQPALKNPEIYSEEKVGYFVVDFDCLPSYIEAGKLTLNGRRDYKTVNFSKRYDSEPVLLAFIQSLNNSGMIVTTIKNHTPDSFKVGLDNLETEDSIKNDEEVGWVAFQTGVHHHNFEFGRTGNEVTHEKFTVETNYSYPGVLTAVASMNTLDGKDGGYVRGYFSDSKNTINFHIEEDQVKDGTDHTTEIVSWLAFYTSECYYIYDLCQAFCPTGFTTNLSSCIEDSAFVFHLILEEPSDIIYDKVQSIPVHTGEDTSFYPNYKPSDPWATERRGYYFSGSACMYAAETPRLSIAPYFTITVWIRPDNDLKNQVIFLKSTETQSMLELSIDSGSPKLKLFPENREYYSYIHSNSLETKTWNFVYAKSYVQNYLLTLSIGFNTNQEELSTSSKNTWFQDTQEGYGITIGSKVGSEFYTGFIYELRIYNDNFEVRSIFTDSCSESCSVCPENDCILSCDIDQWWTGNAYNSCESCEKCPEKCQMNPNYYDGGSCEVCENGTYLESSQCLECKPLCTACNNSETCLSCVENAVLTQNSTCNCQEGYKSKGNFCEKQYFYSNLKVTKGNYLNLTFTSPLSKDLTKKDCLVKLLNKSIDFKYSMERTNNQSYYLSLTFETFVMKNEVVYLEFLSEITSSDKEFLYNKTLQGLLYEFNPDEKKAKEGARIGENLMSAAITNGIATAMVNPNPASFWSLINTIQVLHFIPMASIPITPMLAGFFKSFDQLGFVPNFFEYIFEKSPNHHQNSLAYGYESNLFLLNAGEPISMLLVTLLIWPFLFGLSKIKCLKKGVLKFLNIYKFGVPLRFVMNGYLELAIAVFIQFYITSIGGAVNILNLCIAVCFCVVQVVFPFWAFRFTTKRKVEICKLSEKSAFYRFWGSLYCEFKVEEASKAKYFYVVFTFHKLLYSANLVFMYQLPLVQALVNCALMLGFFIYMVAVKPYPEPITQVSNSVVSFGIFLVFCLVSYFLFEERNHEKSFEYAVLYLDVALVLMQVLASLLVSLKTIYQIAKEKQPEQVKFSPEQIGNVPVSPETDSNYECRELDFFRRRRPLD